MATKKSVSKQSAEQRKAHRAALERELVRQERRGEAGVERVKAIKAALKGGGVPQGRTAPPKDTASS